MMPKKIDHKIKEAIIEALREHGTLPYAARVCGMTVKQINDEMKRSVIFKQRVQEARLEGKTNLADKSIELIKSYAYGENTEKTDRNRLTAAIALANAYEPGFRGSTTVQGKIEHDVRVITAVPRPKYEITEAPKKALDKPKTKAHNVEEVIEGEVIDDN
jgi:hypothetical protein